MKPLRVVVIGAGMAGVLMGIRLKQSGVRDFVILEKGDSVGGTWRENSYPGLHCDFPSHVYRYSFDPNPDWSHRFSPGPEIRRYFENSAIKFHARQVGEGTARQKGHSARICNRLQHRSQRIRIFQARRITANGAGLRRLA